MDKHSSAFAARTGPPIAILGVPFDNVTTGQTLELIDEMIAAGRPHYLATANVDFLVQALKDIELRKILFDAHLVLCDGTPLLWASSLLGNPLRERVAGSDVVPLLLRRAAEKGYRPFFLGGAPGAAEEAVSRLQRELPALKMAGYYAPPFRKLQEMDHPEIVRRIQEARPDILFVAFGCPKQEKWICMHYRTLGVPVCVGIGATIDFLAGQMKRAPVWMRKTGLEWIFRLLQEPRRLFKRYAIDLWEFSRAITRQWWRLRRRRSAKPGSKPLPVSSEADCKIFTLPPRLDSEAVHAHQREWEQAFQNSAGCILDLSTVDFIDSTGIGLLIRFQKRANAAGGKLVLLSPSSTVERALAMMRLKQFFSIAAGLDSARRLVQQQSVEHPVMIKQDGPKSALAWQGELTAANAPEVWELTKAYIGNRGRGQGELNIDLAGLRFIDSTGLGMMIRVKKYALREGLAVSFSGVQEAVRNVLHIAQLEEFLLGKKA